MYVYIYIYICITLRYLYRERLNTFERVRFARLLTIKPCANYMKVKTERETKSLGAEQWCHSQTTALRERLPRDAKIGLYAYV